MLWELSVAEQRYRAVLEVLAGVPVTEGAERYGVSCQGVHAWLHYQQEEISRLEDRSHRVREHPWRISAEVEEVICELRRAHVRADQVPAGLAAADIFTEQTCHSLWLVGFDTPRATRLRTQPTPCRLSPSTPTASVRIDMQPDRRPSRSDAAGPPRSAR